MNTVKEQYQQVQEMIFAQRHVEARSALEALVAEHSGHAAAHFDLGNLYYAAGEMEKALAHYDHCARLSGDNPIYLKNYADLLYSVKKDTDGALALYDRVLKIHPEDIQSLMMTGHLCVSLEKFDRAIGYYNRVLDIEPWNDEAQRFLERVQQRVGKDGQSAMPEVDYAYCQNLVEQGKIDDAVAGLASLVARQPDFAVAYNDLGVLYYRQGDKVRSLENYEKAVAIEPENPTFSKNLADFYLIEQGAVEKALAIYLNVLRDNPEDVDALMVAGHISTSIGNKDAAKVFYERVLDIEPWHFEANERLEQL